MQRLSAAGVELDLAIGDRACAAARRRIGGRAMELQPARSGGERKHAQWKHKRATPRKIAPSLRPKAYPNPIAAAGRALAPWHQAEYPGFAKTVWKALQGRASPHTIRDWHRGKRRAPQWARDLLADAIEKRIAELEHARALLAETKKPGD